MVSTAAQDRVVETLESRLDAAAPSDLRVRLLGELAFGAWRCGAKSWIAGRGHPDGSGPREKLGSWRGPAGRRGLVRSVREAFDAVPASVDLTAEA